MLLLRNVVAAIGIDLEGHGIHRELRKEVRSCHVGRHRRNCRHGRPWGHATLASYRRGRFPKRGWLSATRSVQQSGTRCRRRAVSAWVRPAQTWPMMRFATWSGQNGAYGTADGPVAGVNLLAYTAGQS